MWPLPSRAAPRRAASLGDLEALHLLQQRLGLRVLLKVVPHLRRTGGRVGGGGWVGARGWRARRGAGVRAAAGAPLHAWQSQPCYCQVLQAVAVGRALSAPAQCSARHHRLVYSRPIRAHRLQDGVEVLGQRGLQVGGVQRPAGVVRPQLLKAQVHPAQGRQGGRRAGFEARQQRTGRRLGGLEGRVREARAGRSTPGLRPVARSLVAAVLLRALHLELLAPGQHDVLRVGQARVALHLRAAGAGAGVRPEVCGRPGRELPPLTVVALPETRPR